VKIGPADPEILRLRANKSGTTQNWLPWQRPLRNRKNWTWSRKFTQISSIWWKDRENRSSRYWDSFAHSKKKKKLTQAKYIALLASLPSRLNKQLVADLNCNILSAVFESQIETFGSVSVSAEVSCTFGWLQVRRLSRCSLNAEF